MNASFSVAMTEATDLILRQHLSRSDGQEDLCFTLYHPSSGAQRFSGLLTQFVGPRSGERQVHGTASFNASYFERVLALAISSGMGVAFLHSHPQARSWQRMSDADRLAESGMAGAAMAATRLPLLGLTLSGQSGFWSARYWHRVAQRVWEHRDGESVRVVGRALAPDFCPLIKPVPTVPPGLVRTAHAWGDAMQSQLTRLRVGVVGLGSVGTLVIEQLARMGFSEVIAIDFDIIEEHNLDRTLHAYPENVRAGDLKVGLAARSSMRAAVMPGFQASPISCGIQDISAYRRALDCDVVISCVDRPWPRAILNHLAYAHLIPVIDGGIDVSRARSGGLRSADWGTFVVGPGRRCLECAGQYDAGLVSVEQSGDLDEPAYIESLPDEHPLRKRQNVFAFSMALAAMEVMRLVQLVARPSGVTAPDEERYVFPAGNVEQVPVGTCKQYCSFQQIVGRGENAGHPGTTTP